jgi:1,2-diacylglycerol 3-beta-galactosyltransferase
MPIRLDFALERPPRHLQRARLGIASDLPSVMLTGGGEGMGRVEEIAHAIAERLGGGGAPPLGQMVIVCGRNDRLRERLSGVNWPAPVCVTGFVSNMVDWMSACDLVVTKAGPGTIAEAMSLGLPVILSGHLPGQEAPNVGYVTDNGFGVYEPEPDGIACLVARWLGPESAAREVMGQRARGLARPGAARGIADEIGRAMAALPAPGVREVGVKATGS